MSDPTMTTAAEMEAHLRPYIASLEDRLAQARLLAEKWLRDRDLDVQAMGADLLQVLGEGVTE